MLIDEINLTVKAGFGGRGKIHFAPRYGGPDGGNGGRGADVYIRSTSDLTALNQLAGKVSIAAPDGGDGGSNKMAGRGGADITITLPVGSEISDLDTKEVWGIKSTTDTFKICMGGAGGRGNFEFRSATNRTPREAEPGEPGQIRRLHINLKLFANVGLIGLPNAGKSSLLNALTRAHAAVGSYPFTTLEPNLGVADGVILADIPGLIEGASAGKGLGTKFLKHITKVSTLFHCISSQSTNLLADYRIIRQELEVYDPTLTLKPEIILLTKTDLIPESEIKTKLKLLKSLKHPSLAVTIYDPKKLTRLKKLLTPQPINTPLK